MRKSRVIVTFLVLALFGSVLNAAPAFSQTLTSECSGTRDGDTVTLNFDGSVGSSAQLLADGSWLRTVTDQTSATDQSAAGTVYVLRLREAGTVVDITCDVNEDPGDPEPPVDGAPVCTVIEGTPNRVELSGNLGTSTQLRRNGSWVQTITGQTSVDLPQTGTDGWEILYGELVVPALQRWHCSPVIADLPHHVEPPRPPDL